MYGPYRRWVLYGPYMDDKRLEIRISEDLLTQVDRARGEVKRAAWVKDALRKALPVLEARPEVQSGPPPRVFERATEREVVSLTMFRCPVAGCPRRMRSAAAKCPEHGRTVVEA